MVCRLNRLYQKRVCHQCVHLAHWFRLFAGAKFNGCKDGSTSHEQCSNMGIKLLFLQILYFSICFQVSRSPRKMRALLHKNYLRIMRNRSVLMYFFISPILQVSLYCLAVGSDPMNMKLAIANMEVNGTVTSTIVWQWSNPSVELIFFPFTK